MKLLYHFSQNIRYEPRIKQFEGETLSSKILERGTEVVEDTIIDNQKAIMHRSGVLYRKGRILRIEAADILRRQSRVGQGVW